IGKARMATIATTIIRVPGRHASRSRKLIVHLPRNWPAKQQWMRLHATANAPPPATTPCPPQPRAGARRGPHSGKAGQTGNPGTPSSRPSPPSTPTAQQIRPETPDRWIRAQLPVRLAAGAGQVRGAAQSEPQVRLDDDHDPAE